jgi:hypothetical protein
MKKLYFFTFLFISTLSFSQATELYFSMYGEGSSNNKFLEIYNGTNASVDLADYSVELYANGASTPNNTQTFTAGTMLAAGDVYVLYNSSSNATIINAGDISSSSCNFNGDDAITLLKLGSVIDVIGQIGVDPGSAWDVGSTTGATANHTLVRKSSVCSPNPVALSSFGSDDATSEWDVYASDMEWGQIGSHNGCSTTPSLVISSPINNTTFNPLVTSVDITLSIANFVVGNPGTGIDGHIHYTVAVNGGAPAMTMKYDTTPIALAVSPGNTYTVYVELVDNSHVAITPAVNATVDFQIDLLNIVTDLAALRADVITNGTGKYYQISSNPVITYSRSNRNQKYIQDSSAAILIDDNDGIMPFATGPIQGDALSSLVGLTSIFNGVLQLTPVQAATVASSGNTVTPQVVTASAINANIEAYESELVQINTASFTEADGSTVFASGANYTLNDGSDIVFRTLFNEADYIGQTIPSGTANRVVLVTKFNSTAQVVARSLSDVTLSTKSFDKINGLQMYPNPVSGNALNIVSDKNAEMQVQIFDMLGKQVLDAAVANNTVNIGNLESGIYLVKINEDGVTATRKLVVK